MSETGKSSVGTAEVGQLSAATLIESIPDAVIVAEFTTGQIVAVNGAAETLFECDSDEIVGRDRSWLHPSEDAELYDEAFTRGFENEQVDRLRDGRPLYIETPRGDRKPVEINARRLESEGRTFVLGVFREIGERLDREQRLRETTTRLNTLLDSTPLPVAVLDTSGRVELWNRASEEVFGYSEAKVIGGKYPLFVEERQFNQLIDRITDGETLTGYETVQRARDGSRVDVELYVRPLYDGEGTVTGIIGSAVDITDRERRRQHLDVVHRLLRHNLRNKLTVITSYAAMLAPEATVDRSEQREAAKKVQTAAEDLAELSNHATQVRREITTDEAPSCGLSRLRETVREAVAGHPDTTITTPTVDASVSRTANSALSWLLSRIVEYADDRATLEIDLRRRQRHVAVMIRGEGPLLPAGDAGLITHGTETALSHGQTLEVARAYLTLTSIGGDIIQPTDAADRETFRVEIPRTGVDG